MTTDNTTQTPHTEVTQDTERDEHARIRKYGLVALIVFLALIAFGFMALQSVPGGMLYGVKTNFIEPLNGRAQIGDEAKASYQVKLIEARLEEVKKLSEGDTLSDAARENLIALVSRHKNDLSAAAEIQGEEVPTRSILESVRRFTDASAAMEQKSEDTEHLQEFGEAAEDIRRDSANLYKDLIDRYVERETEENVFNHIREQLSDISASLNDPSLSQETIDDAEVYINRVSPAMTEGNYPRAIVAIAEAMRFIAIEKYGVRRAEAVESETATSTDMEETATSTATSSINSLEEEQTAPVSSPSFTFPE